MEGPTGVVRIPATLSQHLKTPELQYNRYLPLLLYATMVSKTRNIVYIPVTPTKKHQEIYDTIKRTRFFDAITFEGGKKSVRAIAAEVNIHHATAYRWLQQKTLLGSPAYRNNRKQSKILGRKSKLSSKTCKFLVSNDNPVQNQLLDAQIEYHHIPLSRCQVTRKLK